MHRTPNVTIPARIATVLTILIFAIPNAFPQRVPDSRGAEEAARRAQYQEKLQKVVTDNPATPGPSYYGGRTRRGPAAAGTLITLRICTAR